MLSLHSCEPHGPSAAPLAAQVQPWQQMCRWENETQALLTGVGVGLQLQRLDFFHSGRELSHLLMDETLGTWGQSFVFAPINLATVPQVLLCMGP